MSKIPDEIYMKYPGFIEGRELLRLNTNSVSIIPFSEEEVEIDYYPKEKKRRKKLHRLISSPK